MRILLSPVQLPLVAPFAAIDYEVPEGFAGWQLTSVIATIVTSGAATEVPRLAVVNKSMQTLVIWPVSTPIPILLTSIVVWQVADNYVEPGSVLLQLAAFARFTLAEGDRIQVRIPTDAVTNVVQSAILGLSSP